MKKLFYGFGIVLSILMVFCSCEKTEDITKSDIIGDWKLCQVDYIHDGYDGFKSYEESIVEPEELLSYLNELIDENLETPILRVRDGGIYSESFEFLSLYAVDCGSLYLDFDNNAKPRYKLNIESLTNKKLVLSYEERYDSWSGDGYAIVSYKIILEKVKL